MSSSTQDLCFVTKLLCQKHMTTPPLSVSTKSYDRSVKVVALLQELLANPWQEELWLVSMNSHLEILRTHLVFRGTADSCPVHPRDIFRLLIADNATQFVVAHNHPSGRALPSREDLRFTEGLVKAGLLMEIPLLDHVIIGASGHYSFADAGRIKSPTFPTRQVTA